MKILLRYFMVFQKQTRINHASLSSAVQSSTYCQAATEIQFLSNIKESINIFQKKLKYEDIIKLPKS